VSHSPSEPQAAPIGQPPIDSAPSNPESSSPAQSPEPTPANLNLLNSAWERQRIYSKNATTAQERFLTVERLITILALLVVVLAVVQPVVLRQIAQATGQVTPIDRMPLNLLTDSNPRYRALGVLNLLLIVIPIVMTALRAFAIKFSRGNSWVLLRGSAEALKMEIFYFRTRVQQYKANRNVELAEKIKQISQRLKGSVVQQRALFPYENQPPTEVRQGAVIRLSQWLAAQVTQVVTRLWTLLFGYSELSPSPASEPDRNADLDPDGYIKYRLESQFDWYRRKARSYDRQHQLLQTGVYMFGGFGTLLAAVGFQSWVAVTAALAASLVNYLEYRRIEVTLMGYNQAADTLYDIRAWWLSLTDTEKADFKNFEKLVVSTEETIRSEHSSWLQDMQDRLADLYADSKQGEADDESAAPPPEAEADGAPKDAPARPKIAPSEAVALGQLPPPPAKDPKDDKA
jgi:hypothetical protein